MRQAETKEVFTCLVLYFMYVVRHWVKIERELVRFLNRAFWIIKDV